MCALLCTHIIFKFLHKINASRCHMVVFFNLFVIHCEIFYVKGLNSFKKTWLQSTLHYLHKIVTMPQVSESCSNHKLKTKRWRHILSGKSEEIKTLLSHTQRGSLPFYPEAGSLSPCWMCHQAPTPSWLEGVNHPVHSNWVLEVWPTGGVKQWTRAVYQKDDYVTCSTCRLVLIDNQELAVYWLRERWVILLNMHIHTFRNHDG